METQLAELSGISVAAFRQIPSRPLLHDLRLQNSQPQPTAALLPTQFSHLQPGLAISPFSPSFPFSNQRDIELNTDSLLNHDTDADADMATENANDEDSDMQDSDKENEHAGEISARVPGSIGSNS